MGSKFPSNCFVSLPLPACEYYRLYFALDGNTTFRDMVCEARICFKQKCITFLDLCTLAASRYLAFGLESP